MKKNDYKTEMTRIIEKMPSASFENKHGESFTIHSDGITTFLSGDEVDAMVDAEKTINGYLPLFNDAFGTWSKEELHKLGEALIKVTE